MKSSLSKVIRALSVGLVPILLVIFAAIYKIDRGLYTRLIKYEDSPAQVLTAVFLFLSTLISLFIAFEIRKRTGHYHWFFIAFSAFCLLGTLEEINWGQDIFDFQTPEFFLKKSDQPDVNVHNIFQKQAGIKTKHIEGVVLFVYGVCLPLLARHPKVASYLVRWKFIVPPPVLAPSFLIGSLLMIDWPTGDEEEIGEFFHSLCFFLFMVMESRKFDALAPDHRAGQKEV